MADWEKKSLYDLADITMGQSPDSKYYNTVGDGVKFLQGCADFGEKYPNSEIYCSQPKKIASKDSVLFSVRAPVGRINIADTDYCIGRGLAGILVKNIIPEYLYQYLLWYEKFLQTYSQGSTFTAINSNELRGLEVNKPVRSNEQTAIAHILSTVDKAIEQTEKLIAKYKRIKTGLMQDLLTKGIDENGNIRSEKTHKFKDSPLGRIPLEWEVKKLNSITLEIGDGIHATPKYVESSNIYFINGNNLSEGEIVINSSTNCVSQSEFEKYFIELDNNTILLSINGTIGNIAIYNNEKVILGKSVSYIKCKDNVLCNFLYYLLQSFRITHYFDNELTGSTIKNLSLVSIRNTPITMPEDPNEQEKIVDRLHLFDDFISNNYDILKKYQKLKYGLMQDLLTGKVRVPEELIEEINKKIVR